MLAKWIWILLWVIIIVSPATCYCSLVSTLALVSWCAVWMYLLRWSTCFLFEEPTGQAWIIVGLCLPHIISIIILLTIGILVIITSDHSPIHSDLSATEEEYYYNICERLIRLLSVMYLCEWKPPIILDLGIRVAIFVSTKGLVRLMLVELRS